MTTYVNDIDDDVEHYAFADCCPEACPGGPVLPWMSKDDDNMGRRCDYECPACGYRWYTSWALDFLGYPWLPA